MTRDSSRLFAERAGLDLRRAETKVCPARDAVLDVLTDLSDDEASIPEFRQANVRIRREVAAPSGVLEIVED